MFAHSVYAEIANRGLRAQPPTDRAVPTRCQDDVAMTTMPLSQTDTPLR